MARDTIAGLVGAAVLLAGFATARAETHQTTNFVVHAATSDVARAVATEAEIQRKAAAERWLGKELPVWPRPCVIRVALAPGPSGGATSFDYGEGRDGKPVVIGAGMQLRGDLRPLLASTLPHEMTHLVLAYHFGKPLPRWADEGIALTAESPADQADHDARCRELLNHGRGIRLRVLFRLDEYPRDLMALYTQGHSVARFLLTRMPAPEHPGDGTTDDLWRRKCLLEFVRRGGGGNTAESWDAAAKAVYGVESVDALEEAWLGWLRKRDNVLDPNATAEEVLPVFKEKVPADMIPPVRLPGVRRP